MPVILENGSDQIRLWLDPTRSQWSKELQSLLKPYEGELECYPVAKEVGKVGNNSPSFVVPVASTDNKNNIANFFSHAKKTATSDETPNRTVADDVGAKIKDREGEQRTTVEHNGSENNAPLPVPASSPAKPRGGKRKHAAEHGDEVCSDDPARPGADFPPTASPEKTPAKKLRSATSNGSKRNAIKASAGSKNITQYFHD
jgi:hypothetical protein